MHTIIRISYISDSAVLSGVPDMSIISSTPILAIHDIMKCHIVDRLVSGELGTIYICNSPIPEHPTKYQFEIITIEDK